MHSSNVMNLSISQLTYKEQNTLELHYKSKMLFSLGRNNSFPLMLFIEQEKNKNSHLYFSPLHVSTFFFSITRLHVSQTLTCQSEYH